MDVDFDSLSEDDALAVISAGKNGLELSMPLAASNSLYDSLNHLQVRYSLVVCVLHRFVVPLVRMFYFRQSVHRRHYPGIATCAVFTGSMAPCDRVDEIPNRRCRYCW